MEYLFKNWDFKHQKTLLYSGIIMVKFGKQLESQLIPEWQDAYCNYDELKEDLKRIKHQRDMGPTLSRTGSLGLLRSIVSFKPTSSGPLTYSGQLRADGHIISFSPRNNARDVIKVTTLHFIPIFI